jgi:hypothetical protein
MPIEKQNATVAARILAEGPDRHGGKQYWLATAAARV